MPDDPQSDFELALSAAFRALSKDKDANLSFRGTNYPIPVLQKNELFLPKPSGHPSDVPYQAVRGMADSSALQLKLHDKNIHIRNAPADTESREIFEAAELARVEAVGSLEMPGVKENIDAKISNHFLLNDYNKPENLDKIPVKEIISLLIRQEALAENLPGITENLMKKRGEDIRKKISSNLKRITDSLYNQEDFAEEIVRLINNLNLHEASQSATPENEDDGNEDESETGKDSDKSDDNDDDNTETAASFEESYADESREKLKIIDDDKKRSDPQIELGYKPNWGEGEHLQQKYKIYTNEFDQIVPAEKLCEPDELKHLRQQLDARLEKLKGIKKKYISHFLRQLLSQQNRHWEFNLEEGLLDNKKLPMLIADPNYTEYYKMEKESDNANTVVSLLLDNSGSMRGRPITVAAMSAEILAKTLEQFGIKVEILGFTTVEWRGGSSKKKWLENNSPKAPGRLNDLRHIIYKSADTPWRKSQKNMGIMLKEGILKENIDGEAIIWACSRLAHRPEKRRILMVISDGAPVDDSTISANSAAYLDNHLKEVIHTVEKKSDIEIIAIGIGHDVKRYYSNAVTIREVDGLGDTMFQQLSGLFTKKKAA